MLRVKPPTFPVRQNKTTTQRPFSQMNGDNLPLLKKMRSSEISPQVKGKNKSEWRAMLRNLNQKFTEERLVIGNVQRKQDAAIIELKRLHLERRQLRRAMMEVHREEARVEFERGKEAMRLEAERNRINEEIRRLKEEQLSSREKLSKLELQRRYYAQIGSKVDSRHAKTMTTKTASPLLEVDERDETSQVKSLLPGELSNQGFSEQENTQLNPLAVESTIERISPLLVQTKSQVLEVSKRSVKGGILEPLVHVRTGSFIDERKEKSSSFEAFLQTAARRVDNIDKHTNSIEAVAHVNTARLSHKPRVSVILEDPTWTKNNLQIKLAPLPPKTLDDVQVSHKQQGDSLVASEPHDVRHSKSFVEENLQRKLRQQEKQRQILAEPFNHFRRNTQGEFQALGNPPARLKIEEPSMKPIYKRNQQLLEVRQSYAQSIQDLRKQTAKMLDEDITAQMNFEQVNVDEGNRLDKNFAEESYDIGPAAWMKAFINDVLPDNMDPMSFEAMQFCRYLRNKENNSIEYLTLRTPSPLPTVGWKSS